MKASIFCRLTILAVILFVCLIPFTGWLSQAVEEKQINVVFRFDDYSALSRTDIALKIIDVFRKNKAAITFGVIPFVCAGSVHDPSPQDIVPLTSIKGDILKTAFKDGILDIALHGYSHQTINAKQRTEFSGLEYNSQVERLAKGKKFLEVMIDAPITTFIPPWNTYDLNTLLALEELGFSTISAGIQGEANGNSMLNFLPATCDLSQLRDAVRLARSSSDTQPVIVVLFHAYDFREVNEKRGNTTYQEFSHLMAWLKSQKDVRFLSISQATKVINDLSADRFLLNVSIHALLNQLPSFLRERHGNQYATDLAKMSELWLCVGFFYLTILTFVAFTSFMVGYIVFPKSKSIRNIGTYGGIAISIIILIYTFHDQQVGIKGMMVSTGIVGATIGTWLCFLYLKKKRLSDKTMIKRSTIKNVQ